MNNTAIARLALEGGLGIGTVTGGAYAAEYGRELSMQKLKSEGYEDKLEATKSNWRKWTQYQIACYNSIALNKDDAAGRKQEALDCKNNVQSKLKDKLEGIQWDHKAPNQTDANKG